MMDTTDMPDLIKMRGLRSQLRIMRLALEVIIGESVECDCGKCDQCVARRALKESAAIDET